MGVMYFILGTLSSFRYLYMPGLCPASVAPCGLYVAFVSAAAVLGVQDFVAALQALKDPELGVSRVHRRAPFLCDR